MNWTSASTYGCSFGAAGGSCLLRLEAPSPPAPTAVIITAQAAARRSVALVRRRLLPLVLALTWNMPPRPLALVAAAPPNHPYAGRFPPHGQARGALLGRNVGRI